MKKPFVIVFHLMLTSFFYNDANAQQNTFLKTDNFTFDNNSNRVQLDPLQSPGLNFDLNDWKLQTISSSNTFTEISATKLVAGYSSDLFYTDSGDGSVVFKVPSNGGHYWRINLSSLRITSNGWWR